MFLVNDPIQWEKDTLVKMVRIYCKAKHKSNPPCDNCQEMIAYAKSRLDSCKYGKLKPTCEKCPVHCYKPGMRDRVREVMRYAGPRMMVFHPLDAIRHMVKNKRPPVSKGG